MSFQVDHIAKTEFPKVVMVWEASVRATHHFLTEADINYFKPLILNEYLHAVTLRCVRNSKKEIIGFLGVAENSLEMLFIDPKYHKQGVGKTLLLFAVQKLMVTKVDVNEQNENAIEFYKHHGFETTGRSALDASGKPYPILHMELKHIVT